jgi:DNA-binding phage protein
VPEPAAEHLKTEEDMAIYLEAALEENDPALVASQGTVWVFAMMFSFCKSRAETIVTRRTLARG